MDGAAPTNNGEKLRKEGNQHFSRGDYAKAIDSFSRSLFADKSHLAYANRSLAYHKLGDDQNALADAQSAIDIQATSKGYYRKATALIALARYAEALEACDAGIPMAGANAGDLVKLRDQAEQSLKAQHEVDSDDDDDDAFDSEGSEDESGEEDSEDYSVDEEAEAEREAAAAAERAKAFDRKRIEEEEAERCAADAAQRAKAFDRRASREDATAAKAADPTPPPAAPASPLEMKERGNTFYKAGQYEEALKWYTKAIDAVDDDKERAVYLCNRAAALVMLSRLDKAADDAQRASKLDPSSAKAFARAGKSLLQLGQLTEARIALERATELAPTTPGVAADMHSVKLAQALMEEVAMHSQAGAHDKALASLKLLHGRYCPHSEDIHFLELDCIVNLGRYEDVLSQATAMLRRSPDSPNALYLRGKCLFHNGQLDSALKHTAEALRLDPDHKRSKDLRHLVKALSAEKEAGNDAFKERNFETAIQHYGAALDMCGARDVIVSTLRVNRATALARLKRYEEAIADCTRALEIDPKSMKAILRRASCHMEQESWDAAIEDYDAAVEKATDEEAEQSARQMKRKAKLEKLKSQRVDHYKILDIPRSATPVEIKKGYRKMALKWHPDKNAGSSEQIAEAEAKFKEVNDAYECLSDPQTKQRYDSGADLEQELEGHSHSHSHMDPEMYHMFNSFMGGGGGMPRGRRGRAGGFHRSPYDF